MDDFKMKSLSLSSQCKQYFLYLFRYCWIVRSVNMCFHEHRQVVTVLECRPIDKNTAASVMIFWNVTPCELSRKSTDF
jgi:hypothetical protein